MKLKMERTVLRMDSVTLFLPCLRARNGCLCRFPLQRFMLSQFSAKPSSALRRHLWHISGHHAGDRLFCGRFFSEAISSVDHWIAFILLGLIGGHMLLEAIREIRHPEAAQRSAPLLCGFYSYRPLPQALMRSLLA